MALDKPITARLETPDGSLEFEGSWGLARLRNGLLVEAHLIAATQLAIAGQRVIGEPGWRGSARDVHREASRLGRGIIEVNESIALAHAGRTLLIEFPEL